MAKSIKAGSQRIRNNFFVLLFSFLFIPPVFAAVYVDQIAIETPNAIKTVYDVRVHALLRHLYEQQTIVNPLAKDWLSTLFEGEREDYAEQLLVQDYVIENHLNLRPTKEEMEQAVATIEKGFSSPAIKQKTLSDLDLTQNEIKQWTINRLIYEKFITSAMLDRVVITDQKLQTHYQTWKDTRFGNKNYAEIQAKVRDDLSKTLLKEEFQKWVDQEKRRKKMVLKVIQPL